MAAAAGRLNVALLAGAEPARAAATVARAVNAVHAFYDYHATHGVEAGQRLVRFSRTPKLHWRNPRRTGRVIKRMVSVLAGVAVRAGMRVGQALGLRHEDFVSRERKVLIVPREDNPNGARAKTREMHEQHQSDAEN